MWRYVLLGMSGVVAISIIAASTAYGSAGLGNDSIRSYTPSVARRASDTVQVQQQGQGNTRYVAMGDSVAAGAGLPALAGATSVDEVCDRSTQAYPYLIAKVLQTTVVQLACSGAKVDEGIYGGQTRNNVRIPDQLSAAFTDGTPGLITMTIGANDIRWNQFVRQCYIAKCGFAIDSARTKLYRADLRIELTRMLYQIKTRSAGNPPRVMMSGYYSPVTGTECLGASRITSDEVAWLNDQSERMNQAIRSVIALFNFAEYVPVDFTGHEVCSSEPWVQGLESAAPIHPTRSGQAVIAESFLRVINR